MSNKQSYCEYLKADTILLSADPTTRHHHIYKFRHIRSHTAQYKHSFFVRTVPEWNSLLEACVNADTVTAFQAQLRHTPWAVCTSPVVVIREIELRPGGKKRLKKGSNPTQGRTKHNINKITRGNDFRLSKNRSHYDLRKFSFTNRIVNIWNSLPNVVVDVDSVDLFKTRLN